MEQYITKWKKNVCNAIPFGGEIYTNLKMRRWMLEGYTYNKLFKDIEYHGKKKNEK
jgi:hypothetical protein